MTFAAPLGLLALLAVPAIVVLHLFRNRLPERTVAGLFLFPATAAIACASPWSATAPSGATNWW
jgi:hypothetical protein